MEDKNKAKRVPKLRFKGFTDDWEQRKFSNFVKRRNKSSNDKNLPNVSYDDIVSKSGILNKTMNDLGKGKKGILFKKYDVLFGKLRPYLDNRLLPDFDGIAIGDFWVLVSKNSSKFLFNLIQTPRFKYISNISSGSKMPRSDWKLLSKYKFKIPTKDEQEKIGNILEILDRITVLQQRKVIALNQIKAGLLREIFANKDRNNPILRFNGYTNSWIIYKLNNLAKYRRGSFPQPYGRKEWYGGIGSKPFVQVVDVDENLRLKRRTKETISKIAQNKSVFVPKNTVIVTIQGSIGKVAITQYSAYIDRTLLIFQTYKIDIDKYFFAYGLKKLFNIEKRRAPGGTIKTITKQALSNFELAVPSLIEQQKIGKLLQTLDKNIFCQQFKLKRLEKIKKFLLQNMFI